MIAQNAASDDSPPERVVAMVDAKRRRVYADAFVRDDSGVYGSVAEPMEVDPAAILAKQPAGCAVVGEGVAKYRDVVEKSGLRILPDSLGTPRAEVVYELGSRAAVAELPINPRDLVPTYVRLPEAEERWAQRQAAAEGKS